MAIRLKDEKGNEVLRITTATRLVYRISTNTLELPIPDQEEPYIMALGGTRRRISITWREVLENKDQLPSSIEKLAKQLMSGRMLVVYTLVIDEWGLEEQCIVDNLSITQVAGEVTTYECSMELLVGVKI